MIVVGIVVVVVIVEIPGVEEGERGGGTVIVVEEDEYEEVVLKFELGGGTLVEIIVVVNDVLELVRDEGFIDVEGEEEGGIDVEFMDVVRLSNQLGVAGVDDFVE